MTGFSPATLLLTQAFCLTDFYFSLPNSHHNGERPFVPACSGCSYSGDHPNRLAPSSTIALSYW